MDKQNVYSDAAAKYYDQIMEAGYRDYAPFISFMKKILKKTDVVLELGTGTGKAAEKIASFCRLEGVENSPKMLTLLKKKLPKLKVYDDNLEKIPGEEKYDLVFSYSGPFVIKEKYDHLFFWTYLNSEREVLNYFKHLYRLLKKGGRLIINVEKALAERRLTLKGGEEYFSTTFEEENKVIRTHVVMNKKGKVLAKQSFVKTSIPYERLRKEIAEIGFKEDLKMMSVVVFKKV